MGKGTVIILGIIEKRGEEVAFYRKCIEDKGHEVIVIDMSRESDAPIKTEITRQDVARSAGTTVDELKKLPRDEGQRVVRKGVIPILKDLCEKKKPIGITCLGGTTTGLMASMVMRELPYGVPKLILSSSAGVQVAMRWWDIMDINIMQAPVHLVGLNNLVKSLIVRAAAGICGMVEDSLVIDLNPAKDRQTVAITLNGMVEKCVAVVRQDLDDLGYETVVFHAQGIGDRAMEKLIMEGRFSAVVDVCSRRVGEQLYEGRTGAPKGEPVFEAASKMGIPQVIAPGGLNFLGAPLENPQFQGRKKFWLDEARPLSRFNKEETARIGEVMAEKVNKSTGPVKFVIPLKGWSSADPVGSDLYEPETDGAFTAALKKDLKPGIEVREIDAWLEEPQFAKEIVKAFNEVMKSK
ncbi:MAG TPA: Tm-1-like ATP-binding domain-containing protein [Syntrophales bacterium]|nr:Tm-1-like ATP-binding domain-containing protein [Syntrophales bacterium]